MITSAESRPPYRHAQLRRLLEPRSVAVVGVSERERAMGTRAAANLRRFRGSTWWVNPKLAQVNGRPCFADIAALPETPDCVVVALPREQVEPVVRACAARGVGAVVVFASDYAEAGDEEGARLQQRLVEIGRAADMRIVGPNSIGVANLLSGACATFSASLVDVLAAEDARDPGLATPRIGLVSQSGGVGFSLSLAAQRGVAFSHVLTTGNSCDVDVADMVAYLAEDPGCQSIACLFEGMPDPRRFLQAAQRAWEADKPLVVYKIATGRAGAQAALSHSGMLAGSNAVYRAAFARHGVVAVDALEDLIETAGLFARLPGAPLARGVAVATSSGGLAVICADKAEQHGIELPQPGAATRERLQALIPDFGAPRNPCDVTAQVQSEPGLLAAAGEAFLAEPEFGALVVTHPTPYGTDARMRALDAMAAQRGKLLVNLWTSEALERAEVRVGETLAHGAVMRSADRCFAALAAWHRRADLRAAQAKTPPAAQQHDASAAARAAALLAQAPHRTLTEREAKQVLACYRVPVVREQLVQSLPEAVAQLHASGGGVVLKVESPDIAHKTEAGVVRLGLRDEAALTQAWDEVMANARAVQPPARIQGVLVQELVPPGVEIMVGGRIDPQFGPLVVVGLGGILVELLKDTVVELAPVSPAQALGMLERLKGAALLRGFRGLPAVDTMRLAEVVSTLSQLMADQQDRLVELDVNPLICHGGRIVAVDALIVRAIP